MDIARRAITIAAAGLATLLVSNSCTRARASEASSEVPGVSLTDISYLPRSPENGIDDGVCDGYRAANLTATGRAVEARGWIVTSEASLGRYRVISFASGFDQSTSAICTVRNGNIGVFDGAQIVALAYSPRGSDASLGWVEELDNGGLLVWGGGYPAPPLGELHLERDRPRLRTVAPEQEFCQRTVVVPNVYGMPIGTARVEIIASEWRPLPVDADEAQYSGVERLSERGIVEAHACSGTGMGYCSLRYTSAAGILELTTAGEYDRVVSYEVTCFGD